MSPKYFSKSILFALSLFLSSLSGIAQDDDFEVDTFSKVRLGFYSHSGFYRQILLGFQNENATEGIDPGYDAVNVFNLPNDMYFYCCNTQLFIQGVGFFNNANSYPLGIKSSVDGNITIKLESTENFSTSQTFYIYDNVTQQYHNLKTANFKTTVGTGVFNDRFSLRFLNQSVLGTDDPVVNQGVSLNYFSGTNELSIRNSLNNINATRLTLYDLRGQRMKNWEIHSTDQRDMTFQISGFSAGIYIVHLETTAGTIAKKIRVN